MGKPSINWKPELDKRICERCKAKFTADEILKVPNPFGAAETWMVCPQCHAPEAILLACCFPGCWEETSCGTPTTTDYVFTCSKHKPWEENNGR